ncbi:MAG: DNA internalization-related competence protein ComEC/Rec2, partial [Myxococcales bacterium]
MLAWIAGGWLAGLFSGAQGQTRVGPLLAALALTVALSILLHGRELEAKLWVAPLSLLAFCCGLAVSQPQPPRCSTRGRASVLARVVRVRHGPDHARLRLVTVAGRQQSSGQRIPKGTWIETRIENRLAAPRGSLVRFETDIGPQTELWNPSPHPDLRPRKKGACWARWTGDSALVVTEISPLGRGLDAARKRIRAHLVEHLPADTAGVARALVLGDGAALGYEQRQTIAAVGLAHLFAVSGLHVALVSGTLVRMISWILRGLSIAFDARRLAAGLGIPLTLLHALFAGGSPSAWRAALTAALTWLLVAIGRRPSPTAATAAAALALSVPDPSMALRPAFLLSIVATSAILSAPRHGPQVRWSRLRNSAAISARTLVATAPMVWWWFGGVPLVGWLTNILVLPLGSWVVVPLAHLFALTAWAPGAVSWARPALSTAVALLLSVCDLFVPWSFTRRLPPLDVTQGLIVSVACLALLVVRSARRRIAIVAAGFALWVAAEQALIAREQPRDALRVTFVDVGQGDATLIDFPDGRLALVDTGQGGRHPAGRALRQLLAARRRRRIDLVVITHGHPDHYAGLQALIEENQIGELWLNGQLLVEERDGAMARLASAALARNVKLRFAAELCEAPSRFGKARLEVLWPCPRYDPELDLNDNSITIRLTFGHRSFLLTGDLESEAERRLVQRGALRRSDVLKVAHHGSKTSSSRDFLDAVRPSWAVISSGAGNRYGHPS